MQEITREEAETIVIGSEVLESSKRLENYNIIIRLNLSNGLTLIVCYNIQEHSKSYFIEESERFVWQ